MYFEFESRKDIVVIASSFYLTDPCFYTVVYLSNHVGEAPLWTYLGDIYKQVTLVSGSYGVLGCYEHVVLYSSLNQKEC